MPIRAAQWVMGGGYSRAPAMVTEQQQRTAWHKLTLMEL